MHRFFYTRHCSDVQIWYLTKPSQAKPAKKKSSQDEPSFARDSPNTDCVGHQIKRAVLFVLLLGFLKISRT